MDAWLGDKRSDIVTIVDVDEKAAAAKADHAAERQGFRPKIVKDMREVFDDKTVDAISTATPNHWHALCGVWAMQAGKDAYVEKPVSHNIAEGSALIAAARKYDRICQVGTQCRSATAQQEMVRFIKSGGIGEVKFARGLCYKRRKSIGAKGDYKIPQSVDFNLWSGPAPYTDPKVTRQQFHYDWHWQRLYGNGDSGNQGPHQSDIARWGLGIDRHPNFVVSYGGRLGYQAERKDDQYVDAGDTPNTQVSIYDYGDKCIVFETRGLSVDNSDDKEVNRLFQSTKGNKIGVVFYGSNGYCVQKSYSHSIAYDLDFNVIKEFKGARNHFANFLDACQSRDYRDLNADVREGHLSASLSHLGNVSLAVGETNHMSIDEATNLLRRIKSLDDNEATLLRTAKHLEKNGVDLSRYPIAMGPLLRFDPEREVFPGHEKATSMCTREYRTPFVCPTADKV
ncbi:4-carboxy-2-hydroxymuconate-6-semialdehyde dehydrogenase [Crateriforma conspicua]|uniref:4-carboxy-2-hydroxymuconate-6-semialdehyde dehydrogenase n=2 Tax=Crateriforma conspicua TaxID=2527996 RepID=A0A5C6FKN6_9PLAN|nr:4-carboxy-2-hydroxymuconate-6-semialdehyde dehydrogenase [Crateriforma conspicua]